MPDFKGRKDFPEVADDKIKIGDYSGMNRLSIVDIYSPKEEPELRDQIMEPVKGKSNNYDSPILSQQPVIILSDVEVESNIINSIDSYLGKQEVDKSAMPFPKGGDPRKGGDPSKPRDVKGVAKATPKIRHQRQMKEWEREDVQERTAAPPPPKPKRKDSPSEGGELQKIIGDILGKIPLIGGLAEGILESDDNDLSEGKDHGVEKLLGAKMGIPGMAILDAAGEDDTVEASILNAICDVLEQHPSTKDVVAKYGTGDVKKDIQKVMDMKMPMPNVASAQLFDPRKGKQGEMQSGPVSAESSADMGLKLGGKDELGPVATKGPLGDTGNGDGLGDLLSGGTQMLDPRDAATDTKAPRASKGSLDFGLGKSSPEGHEKRQFQKSDEDDRPWSYQG